MVNIRKKNNWSYKIVNDRQNAIKILLKTYFEKKSILALIILSNTTSHYFPTMICYILIF